MKISMDIAELKTVASLLLVVTLATYPCQVNNLVKLLADLSHYIGIKAVFVVCDLCNKLTVNFLNLCHCSGQKLSSVDRCSECAVINSRYFIILLSET